MVALPSTDPRLFQVGAVACLHGVKEQRAFRSSFTRLSFFFRDNGHSEAWKVACHGGASRNVNIFQHSSRRTPPPLSLSFSNSRAMKRTVKISEASHLGSLVDRHSPLINADVSPLRLMSVNFAAAKAASRQRNKSGSVKARSSEDLPRGWIVRSYLGNVGN